MKLIKLLNPIKLFLIFTREFDKIFNRILWFQFNKIINQNLKIRSKTSGNIFLADGMWDNPNQYIRLITFISAIPKKDRHSLAAILRTRQDRSLSTLKAIGFKKFFFIEDVPINLSDRKDAFRLLKNIKSHRDILNLKFEDGFKSFFIYDTVLKITKSPQTSLKSEKWIESFSDSFRLKRFYEKLFNNNNIKVMALSHARKNEFAMAFCMALKNKVDSYHIYSMYESMRIRKIKNKTDLIYPNERITYAEYDSFDSKKKERLSKEGAKYLALKSKRANTDINEKLAYLSTKKGLENIDKIRKEVGSKKCIIVFSHCWYDFPHAYGMKNFTDFKDWILKTYEVAKTSKDCFWIFRAHPGEKWYGGFFLKDLLKELPNNIIILDEKISVDEILKFTDLVITAHGTIALEAPAQGVPVICADKTFFEDWNFVTSCSSRKKYISQISSISKTKYRVTNDMKEQARAFLYLAIAPNNKKNNGLRLTADHVRFYILYREFKHLIKFSKETLDKESKLIYEWINSKDKNYCIYKKLKLHD